MSGFVYSNNSVVKMTSEQAISVLESVNGTKFSEQQLKILNTDNGIKIVACAGSGKTFSLVSLVTKRIMTGEIENAQKLLMTTYSKSGAENMTERINNLLTKVGYKNTRVEVRTLHSFYYSLLKHFNILKNVITTERLSYIRQSVKNCKVSLEEDEIASLDSLFSYQVNNMLTNEKIYKSYVFDLDISLEEYSALLAEFARLKKEAGVMDFDDLQLNVYFLLCVKKYEPLVQYVNDLYKDIYVDEFQDTSAIQYEILKSMIKDSRHIVFVGDDDQCLLEGTKILTSFGYKNIEDISIGESIISASGHGCTSDGIVESIKVTNVINKEVYTVRTKSGEEFTATGNHIVFVEDTTMLNQGDCGKIWRYTLFGSDDYAFENNKKKYYSTLEYLHKGLVSIETDSNSDRLYQTFSHILKKNEVLYSQQVCNVKLLESGLFKYVEVRDLREGMFLCHYNKGVLERDKIVSITCYNYTGAVYDINIKEYRNYIASNIVVHNCIYGWRGAKADLLLNADVDYHIDKLNLDTNYRCTDNILQFAKLGIEHMSLREAKDMKACKENGVVNFVYKDSKDLYDMSVYVANRIEQMIKYEGVAPADISVLVRYNAHAHVLNQLLMLKDIYCCFGNDMKITYQPIFKDIMSIVELCGDTSIGSYDRNACSSVLWKMVSYLGGNNSAKIAEFMANTGCSFTDSLSWILANVFSIGTYHGYAQVSGQIKAKITASFKKLGQESVSGLRTIYDLLTNDNLDERLVGLLCLYNEGMAFMLKKANQKRNFRCYFKFFYTMAKENGFDKFKELMTKIKLYEECSEGFTNSVTLSTIHGSKGLEWKHVFLLGYDNIAFPDVDYILVKEDISTVDMRNYIDGERRLAYVAITRAIDTLTIITDSDNMSLFGLEALGANIMEYFNGSWIEFAKYNITHGYINPDCYKVSESYKTFKLIDKE